MPGIEQALSYYNGAEKYAPDNPSVLLSLARVNHRLENYHGRPAGLRQARGNFPHPGQPVCLSGPAG